MSEPNPFLFSNWQGIIAAAIFILGVVFIFRAPRYKWRLSALLLVIITPLALLGFWYSTGDLGISDWDYYFSYHHNIRRTVLEFNQFPLWNPWTCGGTAALADPEFPLLAPTYWLELIFGIPLGFRLAIYTSIAITAIGMLMLAKRLRLSPLPALLAALGVAFGSVNLLEIVEGHPNIFSVMWLPWILASWLAAYRWYTHQTSTQSSTAINQLSHLKFNENFDGHSLVPPQRGKLKIKNSIATSKHSLLFNPHVLITSLFLTLTFFQGGIYLLSYTAIAFLILTLLVKHPLTALKTTILSGLWAISFSAIKLLPVIYWLRQFQDTAYASSAYTLPYLTEILIGRNLHGIEDIIPNQGSGWHEYGAYVGPIIIILAVFSLFQIKRRLIRGLVISALLAIFLSSLGPYLKPIFDQLPFIPRSNISRVILFAIIPISLLAGFTLQFLINFTRRSIRQLNKKNNTTTVLENEGSPETTKPQRINIPRGFKRVARWENFHTRRPQQRSCPVVGNSGGAPRSGETGTARRVWKGPTVTGPAHHKIWSLIINNKSLLLYTLPLLILFTVAIDLFTLSYALSEQAFVLPKVYPQVQPAPGPIAYTAFDYQTRYRGDDYTRAYSAALSGYGTLTYCSVLAPQSAVLTIHDEEDNQVISLSNKKATYKLISWTPNQVIADIKTDSPTDVILNTNYALGWRVNAQPAAKISGRVAVNNIPDSQTVTFRYRPPGLLAGITISIFTLLISLLIFIRPSAVTH